MRAFFFLLATIAIAAHADDARLSGSVSGPDGKKMAGVTISAKAEASTIKTSVFTDASGNYRFSPLPHGSYRVWAQAIGYQTAKAELALSGTKRQDFRMKANADPEQTFRQLPGNLALDALPVELEHDKRLKQLVRIVCNSSQTAIITT